MARNRAPFNQAIAALAEAPGVRYKDSSASSRQQREITATAYGDKFGTTGWRTLQNLEREVLRVGGRNFYRHSPSTSKDGEAPSGRPVSQWSTNGPGQDASLDPMLDTFASPPLLAHRLSAALDADPGLPSLDDPQVPVFKINGVPALRADTTEGYLYVSKDAPHQVLRLEPPNMRSKLPSPFPTATADLPRSMTAHRALVDSTGMDIAVLSQAEGSRMYETLEQHTRELAKARNEGIDFDLKIAGDLKCSPAGCLINENFTGTVTPKEKSRIATGQLTVVMTVTDVSVGGIPASGCISGQKTVTIVGNTASGTISCRDTSAGAAFVQADAKAAAEAQQRANASGGRATVRFQSFATAYVDALAVGTTEIDSLLEEQEEQRKNAHCTVRPMVPARYSADGPQIVYAGLVAADGPLKRPCARYKEDLAAAEAANPLISGLRKNGKLPPEYITKAEASKAGWEQGKALGNKVPGGQIGGDRYDNAPTDPKAQRLPDAPGRQWYEADLGIDPMMKRSKQPGWRLVYSSDGQAYVTSDHYLHFYQLPNWK
ncbi:ribonuclease domain-containing protein [Streptomyces bicolor]|uniref:ribonuclease domain-containing protein n=3 Tax=Streptomyces TaxID=1883 RepID=UPI00068B6B3C|nr:ribonuclease domain-containing protein [Streptomyces bicolor]